MFDFLPPVLQVTFPILIKIFAIILPLVLIVAWLTFAERKIIGYMQGRIGPNRIGPRGWLQPIADVIKLLLKEIIIPASANRILFLLAPVLAIAPALAVWAVIPFDAQIGRASCRETLPRRLAERESDQRGYEQANR